MGTTSLKVSSLRLRGVQVVACALLSGQQGVLPRQAWNVITDVREERWAYGCYRK